MFSVFVSEISSELIMTQTQLSGMSKLWLFMVDFLQLSFPHFPIRLMTIRSASDHHCLPST